MPDPDDLDPLADGGGTAAGATSRLVHGLVAISSIGRWTV